MAEPASQEVKASLRPPADDIFRSLWASLFQSGRVTGKSVLVCSADRREGASTVACGLALAGSVPAGGIRVALVDFNLRQPTLHEVLGAAGSPGVSEIVCDWLEPQAAAQSLSAGLDFYAAGQINGKQLDALRSTALPGFFKALAEKYDCVVVDAPAVNPYPEAQVLAGALRDVVLVAHTDWTPREAVAQAKKRLEAGGGKVVGLVLNLRTYPIPKFLYRRV